MRHLSQNHALCGLFPLLALALLLTSCYGSKEMRPLYIAQEDGIEISYEADSLLNLLEGKANPLKLVIYQLADKSPYLKYSESVEDLERLLQTEDDDQNLKKTEADIKDQKHYYIQPGQRNVLKMPRLKDTQYLAIVAGYYHLKPGQTDRLFDIPVKIQKKLLKRPKTMVEKLVVRLKLGATKIE